MGAGRSVLGSLVCLFLIYPAIAFAQASFAGIVTDASGAVLPGVTVEISSDALIERTRTTTTDDRGQWRIIDLRPGVYDVKFSLTGFTTVIRRELELSGSATVMVPAELGVGGLQDNINVVAETPVVDVQNAKREIVLKGEFVNALPATRNYASILNTIPALVVGFATSAETTPAMQAFGARGGPSNEGRVMIDGMTVAAPVAGAGVSTFTYNTSDVVELSVNISGGLGEAETGGPTMNIVPRSGGNTFSGQAFFSNAGSWSRAENIDDELRSIGIGRLPTLRGQYDASGSLGGPIKKNQLWFYGTYRQYFTSSVNESAVGGNLFAGDATSWAFAPDPAITEVRTVNAKRIYSGRLTAAFGKNRFGVSQEQQRRCDGTTLTTDGEGCRRRGSDWTGLGGTNTSPEASAGIFPQPYSLTQATWSLPKTNRLLFDAGYSRLAYDVAVVGKLPSDGIFDLIPVTELSALDGHRANFTYRAVGSYQDDQADSSNFRASASYVTGSQNLKVGYQGGLQISDTTTVTNPTLVSYQFNQRSPNQFTIRLPEWQTANRTMIHAVYAQESWTRRRLTLQGALRFDRASSWSPTDHNGTAATSRWNAQPIGFERTVSVRGYNDITPRIGVAYDLLGDGRTAVKFNLGKYLEAATNDGNYVVNNPANRIQTTMTRSWVDADNDRVIDCDILNLNAQSPTTTGSVDTCGQPGGNSSRFANALTGLTQVNPAILGGWGTRPSNWQVGVAIQRQVLPRVSLEAAYNRRWFKNFFVTDNQALGPVDYETWIATAPVDPRLPNGGGYDITRYLVKPEANGRVAQNYVTFETDFGPARTNYWHGVEITGNARMRNGLTFQGGTSTGRGVTDRCETVVKIDSPDPRNCRTVAPFQTSFRGSASYTVPKADVLVSVISRISPPPGITATYNFPNTYVQAQLGHLPAGGTANGVQAVNLIDANGLYAERRQYQFDMRFAKVLRFAGMRANVGADLYNIFNVNTPTVYDGTYDATPAEGLGPGGEWLRPTTIVQPRFARVNVTLTF